MVKPELLRTTTPIHVPQQHIEVYNLPSPCTTTCATYNQESVIYINNLVNCREHNTLQQQENNFFKQAMIKQLELGAVKLLDVFPGEDNSVVTEHAFLAPAEGSIFLEANKVIDQTNKESLSTLLDWAEESSCNTIFVCVDRKNENAKEIMYSYTCVGFTTATTIKYAGYYVLGREL